MKLSLSQKGRFLLVVVDGEEWRTLHRSIFGRGGQLPKQVTCWDELEEQFFLLEERKALRWALSQLAKRSYHSQVLAQALSSRLVSDATIEKAIIQLKEWGYLDDDDYLERAIATYQARHFGPKAIFQKLTAQGVAVSEVEEALARFSSEESEQESVRSLIQKRYASCCLTDPKARAKVVAALQRKGFSLSLIFSALKPN